MLPKYILLIFFINGLSTDIDKVHMIILYTCSDGSLPRAYGLPKIHKPGCPLRIVSSVGSPLYSLATFLHKKLFKTIPRTDSYVKNSFELVERLRDVHFTGAHELTFLDVTSLFMNMPTDIT